MSASSASRPAPQFSPLFVVVLDDVGGFAQYLFVVPTPSSPSFFTCPIARGIHTPIHHLILHLILPRYATLRHLCVQIAHCVNAYCHVFVLTFEKAQVVGMWLACWGSKCVWCFRLCSCLCSGADVQGAESYKEDGATTPLRCQTVRKCRQ